MYRQKPAYEQFSEDLKRGKIGPVVLLRGTEQYLVSWARQQIIRTFVHDTAQPLDLIRFDADTFQLDRVIEACETVPVLSPKKVVILDHFYYLWGKARKEVFGEAQRNRLQTYLQHFPASAILVICAPEPDEFPLKKKGNRLSGAIKEHGQEYCFTSLNEPQLLGFMKKRLVSGGKSASRQTMEMMAAESGYFNDEIDYGLYHLDHDLQKIIALAAGTEITPEEVELGLSGNLEHNVFKLLDQISLNRKDESLRLVQELLLSGYHAFQLLARIINQLELMLEVSELRSEGKTLTEMTRMLGVHQYPVKKAMGFARGQRIEHLRRVLHSAFAVEKHIKRGLLKEDLALELFIAGI